MKEELTFSETLILTRATRRNISEDSILQLNIVYVAILSFRLHPVLPTALFPLSF
jgi:hypothetical protein